MTVYADTGWMLQNLHFKSTQFVGKNPALLCRASASEMKIFRVTHEPRMAGMVLRGLHSGPQSVHQAIFEHAGNTDAKSQAFARMILEYAEPRLPREGKAFCFGSPATGENVPKPFQNSFVDIELFDLAKELYGLSITSFVQGGTSKRHNSFGLHEALDRVEVGVVLQSEPIGGSFFIDFEKILGCLREVFKPKDLWTSANLIKQMLKNEARPFASQTFVTDQQDNLAVDFEITTNPHGANRLGDGTRVKWKQAKKDGATLTGNIEFEPKPGETKPAHTSRTLSFSFYRPGQRNRFTQNPNLIWYERQEIERVLCLTQRLQQLLSNLSGASA